MAGSSGWLSNVPLANRALSLKDKALHRRPSPVQPNSEIEVDDQGDEGLWYDCTDSEESGDADTQNSHVTVKPLTSEEETELLQYMPSLFGTELPPCNAEIQIAYENVSNRLRARWLDQRGRMGSGDLCCAVKEELSNQNFMFPAFSLKGVHKKRKPWRREIVFKYELRWIEYFVKEAQAQTPELMTESELMERKKEPSVPAALGLVLQDRPDVSKMWDEWNARRRAKKMAVPQQESDQALTAGVPDGHGKDETNGNVKEGRSDSGISNTTVVEPETKSDDAQVWSNGGHD